MKYPSEKHITQKSEPRYRLFEAKSIARPQRRVVIKTREWKERKTLFMEWMLDKANVRKINHHCTTYSGILFL